MKLLNLLLLLLLINGIQAQNIGIGTTTPSEKLEIATGNLKLSNSDKGIILNQADLPMITRAWNPFTSGLYNGLGRWGLFMEPARLTLGVPWSASAGIKVSAYDLNSTIIRNMLDIGIDVSGFTNTKIDGRVNITHNGSQPDAQLTLTEDASDFSRLTFMNTISPQYWTIAAANTSPATSDRMNFFNSSRGDIMRLTGDGNLEIPSGNLVMTTDKGVILNTADRPLITRGWDAFTSGVNIGLGRWGLFMEPTRITNGFPAIAGAGYKIAAYNANSTINKNVVDVSLDGSLNGIVQVDGKLTRPSTPNANLVPIAYGSVRADGVIRVGTGNFTCTKYGTGAYAISVTGETYSPDTHIVQATVIGPSSRYIHVSTVGIYPGSIIIFISNTSDAGIDGDFTFTVLKP